MRKTLSEVLKKLIIALKENHKPKDQDKVIDGALTIAVTQLKQTLATIPAFSGLVKILSANSTTEETHHNSLIKKLLEFFYICQTILQLKALFIPNSRDADSTDSINAVHDVVTTICSQFITATKDVLDDSADAFAFIESLKQPDDIFTDSEVQKEISADRIEILRKNAVSLAHCLYFPSNTDNNKINERLIALNTQIRKTFYNHISENLELLFIGNFSWLIADEGYIRRLGSLQGFMSPFFLHSTDDSLKLKIQKNIPAQYSNQWQSVRTKLFGSNVHGKDAVTCVSDLLASVPPPNKTTKKIKDFAISLRVIDDNSPEKKIKTICRFHLCMQPVTPETLITWVKLYALVFDRFTYLNQELHEAIYYYRYQLMRHNKLQFIYYSLQNQIENNTFDKRIFNLLLEILPEYNIEKIDDIIFQDHTTSISMRRMIGLVTEVADQATLAQLPPQYMISTAFVIPRDNTTIVMGNLDTDTPDILKTFFSEVRACFATNATIKIGEEVFYKWDCIHTALVDNIKQLKTVTENSTELKDIKTELLALETSLASANSATVEIKLLEFLLLCHAILSVTNTFALNGISNTSLDNISAKILIALNKLISLSIFSDEFKNRVKHENFIIAFILTPNIFSAYCLREEIVSSLNIGSNFHVKLATQFSRPAHTTSSSENTELEDYLKHPNQENLISILLRTGYSSDESHGAACQRSLAVHLLIHFFHFSKNTRAKIAARSTDHPTVDAMQVMHQLNTKIYETLDNFFSKLAQSTDTTADTSDQRLQMQTVRAIAKLCENIPKNIASGAHQVVQKPLKNVIKLRIKLSNFIFNIITGNNSDSEENLVKNICRFYLKMQPYTPEVLITLVEIYQYIFNKFLNLDEEVHNAIFANRYLLTPEAALAFLYFSFQCQKEKKILKEEVAIYLTQIKSAIENVRVIVRGKTINIEEIILLSQDCALQTSEPKKYYISVSTSQHSSDSKKNITQPLSTAVIVRTANELLSKEVILCQDMQQLVIGLKVIKKFLLASPNMTTDQFELLVKTFLKDMGWIESNDYENFRPLILAILESPDLNTLTDHIECYEDFSENLFQNIQLLRQADLTYEENANNSDLKTAKKQTFNFEFLDNLIKSLKDIFSSDRFATTRIHQYVAIKESAPERDKWLATPQIANFFRSYPMLFSRILTRNDGSIFYNPIGALLIKPTQRMAQYKLLTEAFIKAVNEYFESNSLEMPLNTQTLLKQLLQATSAIATGADRLQRRDSMKLLNSPTRIGNSSSNSSTPIEEIIGNGPTTTSNTDTPQTSQKNPDATTVLAEGQYGPVLIPATPKTPPISPIPLSPEAMTFRFIHEAMKPK